MCPAGLVSARRAEETMVTSPAGGQKPGQRIGIASVPNLRDIGGYAAASGGRVRIGQLYRSTELNHLHGEDLDAFSALGSVPFLISGRPLSARPRPTSCPRAPRSSSATY